MMEKTEYVSGADCKQAGFVRTKKGVMRLSVLERLYKKGHLDYGNKKFCADDRLRAGERLTADFEKARFTLGSSSRGYERVDCQSRGKDFLTDIRSRYLTAIRHVPCEFWPAVRAACIENRQPEADKNLSARRRLEENYVWRCDLCRGLDRLIEYYQNFKKEF